jgi:dephospho-CoA kinase
MNKSVMMYPAILVLTGASGAGKTTLTLKLKELAIPGVESINCDRVKIEVPETADSSDLQVGILRYWVSQLSQEKTKIELAVLDTQIRPHRAREVLNQVGILYAQIVLVDCDPIKRNERLRIERSQPELATPQMDCWAAYLRGQADALNLSIIDTSEDSIDNSLKTLERLVRELLNRKRVT